jgi:hypothetical protein
MRGVDKRVCSMPDSACGREAEIETVLGKIADLAKHLSEPAWTLEGCAQVGRRIGVLVEAALDAVRSTGSAAQDLLDEIGRLRSALRAIVNDSQRPKLANAEYLRGVAIGALDSARSGATARNQEEEGLSIHVDVCPDCGEPTSYHPMDPPMQCMHDRERYVPVRFVEARSPQSEDHD